MKYSAIILAMLSLSASASPIPVPVVCKPQANNCTWSAQPQCWQRTDPDDGTIWRLAPGYSGWTIGHYAGVTGLAGFTWAYGYDGHYKDLTPTNCEVTKILNDFRRRWWQKNYAGITTLAKAPK